MSFSIDGLATGLDTTGIINQLMQIERQPAAALEKRIDANKDAERTWYGVRSNLNKVTTAANTLRVIGADFMPTKASSSLDAVKVTSSAGAKSASATFHVKQLATTASRVSSAALARDAVVSDQDTTISFTNAKGEEKQVAVKAGTTFEGLRDLINDNKDLGVKAALINTGDGNARLQLSAASSGADGNFTVNASALTGLGTADFQQASEGKDALVTIPGTDVEVKSPTNTFTGAVDGMTFTISKEAVGKDVTLSIEDDQNTLVDRVKGLVNAINETLGDIDSAVSYGIDYKGGKGEVTGVAGKLAGNSTARSIRDNLLRSFTNPVDGNPFSSMGAIGVEVTKEGKLEFKEDKFKEALKKDPAAVEQLIRGDGSADDKTSITARVKDMVKTATDATSGTIQRSVDSLKNLNRDFRNQVETIDGRVNRRRNQLRSEFAAMEKAMAQMQRQQQWLIGQLGSLNAQR
ncbi:flagellar filament capping protein FliD [Stomatohabitans albus]|uniref:flagellar filament capping protein FliD n=1 Tax=Stomatohabitans albus TaxID=3110766 RepID=UPI00300CE5A0